MSAIEKYLNESQNQLNEVNTAGNSKFQRLSEKFNLDNAMSQLHDQQKELLSGVVEKAGLSAEAGSKIYDLVKSNKTIKQGISNLGESLMGEENSRALKSMVNAGQNASEMLKNGDFSGLTKGIKSALQEASTTGQQSVKNMVGNDSPMPQYEDITTTRNVRAPLTERSSGIGEGTEMTTFKSNVPEATNESKPALNDAKAEEDVFTIGKSQPTPQEPDLDNLPKEPYSQPVIQNPSEAPINPKAKVPDQPAPDSIQNAPAGVDDEFGIFSELKALREALGESISDKSVVQGNGQSLQKIFDNGMKVPDGATVPINFQSPTQAEHMASIGKTQGIKGVDVPEGAYGQSQGARDMLANAVGGGKAKINAQVAKAYNESDGKLVSPATPQVQQSNTVENVVENRGAIPQQRLGAGMDNDVSSDDFHGQVMKYLNSSGESAQITSTQRRTIDTPDTLDGDLNDTSDLKTTANDVLDSITKGSSGVSDAVDSGSNYLSKLGDVGSFVSDAIGPLGDLAMLGTSIYSAIEDHKIANEEAGQARVIGQEETQLSRGTSIQGLAGSTLDMMPGNSASTFAHF